MLKYYIKVVKICLTGEIYRAAKTSLTHILLSEQLQCENPPLTWELFFHHRVEDLSFISATERINWRPGVFPYSVDKNTSLGMWRSCCFTERRVTENETLRTGDLFHRGMVGRTGHRTYPTCITIHTYIQSYHNTKSVACEHPTSIVFLTIEIHYLCSRFRSSSLISWKMF